VDGARAGNSNVGESTDGDTLTIDDVIVHVLNAERRYDLGQRRPL
jgi:hypothetical protein